MWRKDNWVYLSEPEEEGEGRPASPPWKLLNDVPLDTSEIKDGRRVSKRAEKASEERRQREQLERARRAEEERERNRRRMEARERLKASKREASTPKKPRVSAPPALMIPDRDKIRAAPVAPVATGCQASPSSEEPVLPTLVEDAAEIVATGVVGQALASDASRISVIRSLTPESDVGAKLKMRPGEALKAIRSGGAGIAADLRLLHAGAAARAAAAASLPTPSLDARSTFSGLDDSDSELSSVPPSDSEDVSSDEQEEMKRRKSRVRKRIRKHGLPTPSATSGSSASPPRKRVKTYKDPTVLQSKDRKAFLTAGLYSSSLKQAYEDKSRRASAPPGGISAARGKSGTPLPSTATFPRPINYGAYLLEPDKPHDFRLPFDIYDDYIADLGGDLDKERERFERLGKGKKPDKYDRIRTNAYPFRKVEKSEIPPAVCMCKDGDCSEGCINGMMQYLCSPASCPRGADCKNGPLHLRKDGLEEGKTGLKVFYTGNRGFGLRTEVTLSKGRFVIEYRGEVISRDESYRRVLNEYRGRKSFYFLDYDGYDVLDAGMRGNCARFINHSCDPNLKVMRFKLSGLEEYQIGLFALRDIQAGEELSYDYGWQNFSDLAPSTSNIRTTVGEDGTSTATETESTAAAPAPTAQKCYCGAANCIGALGAKKKSSEREKGRGAAVALLKKKSRKRKRKVAKVLATATAAGTMLKEVVSDVVDAAVETLAEVVAEDALDDENIDAMEVDELEETAEAELNVQS